jgi:threonine/homoserine/homoserine lactone efflux protein
MPLDAAPAWLFTLAAIALLGSPGPGIAALIAVGRGGGVWRGLRFYGGLQAGLALAAGISAAGLASVIAASPALRTAAAVLSAGYLLYLAFRIATAPVAAALKPGAAASSTALAGFLLGVANPKAYVAFVSLMASHAIARGGPSADAGAKWTLCVLVMIVVDLAWLGFGMGLGRARLNPGAERALNLLLALMIVATTMLEWLGA